MNPGYIAVALILGAAFVSTSSALAATPSRDAGFRSEDGQGQRIEMRRNGEDGKSLFIGTVTSISGNALTVASQSFGSSTTPVSFVIDATNAQIIRVTKTSGSVNSATTTIAVSQINNGELVSVVGTKDETNHTITATEVRVGEFVAMFGRGGEIRKEGENHASSTEIRRPSMNNQASSTRPLHNGGFGEKKNASTTPGINNQHEEKVNTGFWQKFRGFFGFK